LDELRAVDGLEVQERVELRRYTRFGIGGVADLFAETTSPQAFARAVAVCQSHSYPVYVMGDGSNVIVSDDGFRGLILRFIARGLSRDGNIIAADAGAPLQALVDYAIDAGLRGLETLAGIPGSVGAAIYGNAGAYGHSISERVEWVELFDGSGVRKSSNAQCEFDYRESIFKRQKSWVIFRAGLALEPHDAAELRKTASEIMAVRDQKFPPTMRCAGSIFKNLYVRNLPPAVAAAVPERVVREGKVASAYFLEQVGAKGMRRGGIEIASYHANLIYNTGEGTAADLRAMIFELKKRVREKYGFEVEEEVQYVGEFGTTEA
jgi:UDP-N-acetylmuramate dehydrogenase